MVSVDAVVSPSSSRGEADAFVDELGSVGRPPFHNCRGGCHIPPDCFAYSLGSDLPQIAQAMAAIQPTVVNENKLRRAISVILACLRFTAIKIGIALMAITAKSSNVLISGRPTAENNPSITPASPFREGCRL